VSRRETPSMLTDMLFSLSYLEREDASREVTEAQDIFSVRTRPSPVRIAEIKTNVAAVFNLPDSASILVTELRCTEPGCPPLETVIAILQEGQATIQHKVHKAVQEITSADIRDLASTSDGLTNS
jgi:hypothetical protein